MTTIIKLHPLTVTRAGADFILSQTDHTGEGQSVALHLSQIRTLAEAAGLLDGGATSEREQRQARSVRLLMRKLLELQDVVIDEKEAYQPEIWLRIPLLIEVAGMLFEDVTGEQAFEPDAIPTESADEADGHGRPPSGAERTSGGSGQAGVDSSNDLFAGAAASA